MLGNAGAVSHPIEGPLSYVLLSTSVVTLLSQMPQPTVYHFSKQTVCGPAGEHDWQGYSPPAQPLG